MKEFYQQVGCACVRDKEGNFIPNVPLYIKISEVGKYGVSPSQEDIIHKISDIVIKHYERELNEFLDKQKKQV